MGGTTPVTGFHSVMDRPLSVSRVAPPTTIVATTDIAVTISQRRRIFSEWDVTSAKARSRPVGTVESGRKIPLPQCRAGPFMRLPSGPAPRNGVAEAAGACGRLYTWSAVDEQAGNPDSR